MNHWMPMLIQNRPRFFVGPQPKPDGVFDELAHGANPLVLERDGLGLLFERGQNRGANAAVFGPVGPGAAGFARFVRAIRFGHGLSFMCATVININPITAPATIMARRWPGSR